MYFLIILCRLHPSAPEHIVPVGGNNGSSSPASFRPRCSGRDPVEWVFPDDSGYPASVAKLQERTSITEEEDPGDLPRPFISHLLVEDLHRLDTGEYMCR